MSALNSIRRRAMSAASAYVIGTLALSVAGAASAQNAPGVPEGTVVEEVVVTGIRAALDDALRTKRSRDTIGEGISADDIGSLPALDIAEALQVIPGVQVNRENNDGAFRYGEISLRGLPGAFTNTTANGQSFASPSGSVTPAEGVPNAFGAFSSSVFDGVWVNKSSRADLVEGGIAGTVDQRLARALSRPDGEFTLRIGAQYEELPDEVVGNVFAAGTKHLIEDKLAVTFRYAHEQEHFRRDGINFTNYAALTTDGTRNRGGFYDPSGQTFDQWKAANGIAATDTVLYPSSFRQYAETREGYRTSFVGGIEYQVTPELKLAANYLFTDRDLDLSAEWLLPVTNINTSITPTSTPFAGYTNDDGSTTWVVPGYDYLDITYSQSSRGGFNTQKSEGLFLTAEYETDKWFLDGSIAVSEAEFLRVGGNYQAQYAARTVNGHLNNNGTFGSINTGSGNIDDYVFTLNLDPAITTIGTDLDLNYPRTDDATLNNILVTQPNGIQQRFFTAGNEVYRDRTDSAVNFNVRRQLGIGFLESVQIGARRNWQTVDSSILFQSIAGIDTSGLSNDLFVPGTTNLFGNRQPDGAYLGPEWEFIDYNATEAMFLEAGISNPNNYLTSPYQGTIYRRTASGELDGARSIASTDTTITAIYFLNNFEGEVFGFEWSGNSGVRYVKTELDGEGFSIVNGIAVATSATKEYDNVLPALNVSVELTPDLYLRFAYSDAMNRPNPAGFTPSTSITEQPDGAGTLGAVDVTLPSLNVEAYTSQNFDVSLEWYNRRGSLLSVAAFRKDVAGFIDQRLVCPEDGGDLGYGTLTATDLGGGNVECTIDADGREIRISETFNYDSNIEIDGLEIAVQQDLSFLENPFLAGFGIQASASFLNVGGEDPDGNPARVQQISDQSYNVATYWENDEFSARVAYNWRSEYYLQGGLSITGAEDRLVAPRGQLDFIARYNVTDDLIIEGRAFNILDVLYEEYQSDNEQMVRQTAYDGRTFALNLTYKF